MIKRTLPSGDDEELVLLASFITVAVFKATGMPATNETVTPISMAVADVLTRIGVTTVARLGQILAESQRDIMLDEQQAWPEVKTWN